MNRLFSVLLVIFCFQTSSAQVSQTPQSDNIPVEVQEWLTVQLSQAKVKTLQAYGHPDFFKRDTIKIVGYIKGYVSKTGFTSGIIDHGNVLTSEAAPATIRVYEDGRFEGEIIAVHPVSTEITFRRRHVTFYAEPGNTVGIILDSRDFLPTARNRKDSRAFEYTEYLGPSAVISKELSEIRIHVPVLGNLYKTMRPEEFKRQHISMWFTERERVDSLLHLKDLDPKTQSIVRNEVDLSFGSILFDYSMSRGFESKADTSNETLKIPTPTDYYDFIDYVDLNNNALVISSGFSTFINRLEFSPLLPLGLRFNFEALDSLATVNFNTSDIPLIFNIAKLRTFTMNIPGAFDDKEVSRWNDAVKKKMHEAFLREEVDRIERIYKKNKEGYQLPDTEGAKVFKKIIDKYRGKVLIVDFWAQWCAPCRQGIEESVELRKKHQNHPDLDFVFITDVEGTPDSSFFRQYGQENHMTNSYRVSADEYKSLRELFKFNGIPRYILVDDTGRIRNDNFSLGNLKSELFKRFPEKFEVGYL